LGQLLSARVHPAAGCRAHGPDAGPKDPGWYVQLWFTVFLRTPNPYAAIEDVVIAPRGPGREIDHLPPAWDRGYTACWIWTSENSSSIHFGETLGPLVGPHPVLLPRELEWKPPICLRPLTPLLTPTDPNRGRLRPTRLDDDPPEIRFHRAFSDINRHPDTPRPP
jgi:hypothetical protein